MELNISGKIDDIIKEYSLDINERSDNKDNSFDNSDFSDDYSDDDLSSEVIKNYLSTTKITPLSISAQSAKAKMTLTFDLYLLATLIAKSIKENKDDTFLILGVLYKDIHEGIIKKPKSRKKGVFPNNMAILIKSPMGTNKNINMKIFTGKIKSSISMVGCKIKEDGISAIHILEQYILKQKELFTNYSISDFKINEFETTCVISNYSIKIKDEKIKLKFNRNKLFNFLYKKYGYLFISYDPVVYVAVKIGFYFNSNKNIQNGVCDCLHNICTLYKNSKGNGNGIGECKKVTIAIFESGNIVITGGRNIFQTKSAYDYINIILINNLKYFSFIFKD
jgi:hypothetical protein